MNANTTIKSLEYKIRLATEKLETLKARRSVEDDIYKKDEISTAIDMLYDYREKCRQSVTNLCYIQGKKITDNGLEDA